jgi:hypothetical protein
MAGEWIPIDCNLGTKPEVLELVDETGVPVEAVVYRLIQLWSWAALNTADGTIRGTPRRLASVAGGDEAFWLAVERVGWLTFVSGNVVIAGWEKRFSQGAKARALAARRQDCYRSRSSNGDALRGCNARPSPEEKRGEEKREEEDIPAAPVPTSKPPKASGSTAAAPVSWDADAGWQGIADRDRQEWAVAYPGAVIDQELAKATAWLRANPKRAGKRNYRAFLVRWLSKTQNQGGSNREPGNRPGTGPAPTPPERKRFYRADAAKSLTDTEYQAWRDAQRQPQEAR